MSLFTTVCRVCLAVDVNTISLTDARVQAVYEKISSSVLHTVDKRPVAACYICYSRLIKCYKLMQTSARAETVLTDLVHKYKRITKKSIDLIDREANGLCGSLCISKVECIDSILPPQVVVKTELVEEEQNEDAEGSPKPPVTAPSNQEGEKYEETPFSATEHFDIKEEDSESYLEEDTSAAVMDKEKQNSDAEDDLPLQSISQAQRSTQEAENVEGGDDQELEKTMNTGNIQPGRDSITKPTNQLYKDKKHLQTQLKAQKATKSFECDGCQRRFNKKHVLLAHLKHWGRGLYKCDVCQKEFSYKCVWKNHNNTHSQLRTHPKRSKKKDDVTTASYKCYICSRRFTEERKLERHLNIHNGKKRFECSFCGHQFDVKQKFDNHLMTHTGEKPYRCDKCPASYIREYELKNHQRRHTNNLHTCEICKKQFMQKAYLTLHLKSHASVLPYECHHCQQRFSKKSSLIVHLKRHINYKPTKCKYCDHTFSDKALFRRHLTSHSTPISFQCDICKRIFNSKNNMASHIKTHYRANRKKAKCNICLKEYINKCDLNKHIKKSHTELPHKCSVCHIYFIRLLDLKRHLTIHAEDKPYQCTICRYRFSKNTHLKRHLTTHSDKKPFKCEVCHRRFNCRSNMLKHALLHTGEKPHKCEFCEHRFTERGSMLRHMRIHASDKSY